MTEKNSPTTSAEELRRRAENCLQDKAPSANGARSTDEMQRLLHELQVHQIELEMQNEALQAEADVGHHFTDLYEFAPVAYFSIGPESRIRLLNLAASRLLGVERSQLSGQRLAAFVDPASLPIFNAFLRKVLANGGIEACELGLVPQGQGTAIQVHIDAVTDKDGGVCNLAVTDISELKRLATTLRESKEDLNRAQAVAHIGSWRLKVASNELLWSEENYRIFGVPQGTALTYETFLDRAHPADREFVNQHWMAALQGAPYDIDHRIVVGETIKWVREQANLEFDEQGELLGGFGTTQDITERKQLAAEIRKGDQYRRAILDNIPCLAWLKDEQSRFLAVNTPFASAFGQPSPEALVGKSDIDIVPSDLAELYRADDRWVLESGASKCVEEIIETGGERRWFETWKSPVTLDGRTIGTVGFSRDISQVREMNERLRESEAFNIAILDSLTAQVVVLDENGLIVATNRAWEEFVAANYGPELAKRSHGLHYCSTCGLPRGQPCQIADCRVWTAIDEVVSGLRGSVTLNYPCKVQDGLRWFKMSVYPLPGERRQVVVAHEDITELKKAIEEQKTAKAEAENANHAKSRFLAAASHDLRQPLFALSLYVGMLKNKLAPTDSMLMANMASCVSSLNELLGDLLDISKLDAGVVIPEVKDFAVDDLFNILVSIHAPEAVLKGLQLRCVPTGLNGSSDPVLFKRMLGNLIANAIRYTEHGGILVGCRRHQGKFWVEVWDSGIGIPEDKIDDIFEEFRQLGAGERNRGSGLGLAIVAKAAALLGLQIRVRSRPGKGSLFAIELPISRISRVEERGKSGHRLLRIALVDDNATVLTALACALQSIGHEVVAAATGRELLDRLAGEPPDVVISDYRLAAGQTGFDVVALARTVFGEKLPALLITGDTDPKLMRSMADRGVIVLHKPVEIEAVQACITDMTDRRLL